MLIRYNVFDVNNGNEDKENLIHTESYDVKNVVNVYFPSMDTRAPNDRIGGWFIRYTISVPCDDSHINSNY